MVMARLHRNFDIHQADGAHHTFRRFAASPALWTAYEADLMTLEVLQAFTLTADHATQERVWNELPEWDRDNAGIERRFTWQLVHFLRL